MLIIIYLLPFMLSEEYNFSHIAEKEGWFMNINDIFGFIPSVHLKL